MRNKQWLAFASFFISTLGYGVWNVLIMLLHRGKMILTCYYVLYGLTRIWPRRDLGGPLCWCYLVSCCCSIFLLKFLNLSQTKRYGIVQMFEKDINKRRTAEHNAMSELKQRLVHGQRTFDHKSTHLQIHSQSVQDWDIDRVVPNEVNQDHEGSAMQRKRAGTNTLPDELLQVAKGQPVKEADYERQT